MIIFQNSVFSLSLSEDAAARSLCLKGSSEELLSPSENCPLFSVTQERPYNNEIKLTDMNKRTAYPANHLRQEGNDLIVGLKPLPTKRWLRSISNLFISNSR